MRIWSVHPQYLDRQGLTAGWRESLLAQKVLTGTTKGYRNHPQLRRFRAAGDGAASDVGAGRAISTYLHALVDEASRRGYAFDRTLVLGAADAELRLEVTDGQVAYEWAHLRAKLAVRSPDVRARWADVVVPDPHPLFRVVAAPRAEWEVVTVSEAPGAGT